MISTAAPPARPPPDDRAIAFALARAAHRLSTGNIEAVVKAQAGISDAAVVGAADPLKGEAPHGNEETACMALLHSRVAVLHTAT